MPVKQLATKRRSAPKVSVTCRTLQEIGAMLVAGGHGHAVVAQIAKLVRDRCHYRWVGIYKIAREQFVIEAGTGDTPPAYPRFPVSQGLSAEAIETRRTVNVPDVSKDKRFLPNFWTTRSEIIVPIIDDEHERAVGVIIVESAKVKAFDKTDREFLEGVARIIWRALR